MVKEVAPNLSYHYWGLGIRGLQLQEEASPMVLVRGSEFNHEKEIEMKMMRVIWVPLPQG